MQPVLCSISLSPILNLKLHVKIYEFNLYLLKSITVCSYVSIYIYKKNKIKYRLISISSGFTEIKPSK